MPQQPEKPQQPQLPNDTRSQAIGSEELPYVNEVEAALARKPRLGARFLSLAVGLFFLILGIWANFAEIDEVTHANGQVISSQRTQIIQKAVSWGPSWSVKGKSLKRARRLRSSTTNLPRANTATPRTGSWRTSFRSSALTPS